MLQARGGADLAQEPLAAERRAEIGMQHLDGHVAIVLEVVREVDRGHAAGAEFALDAVAVGEGGVQARADGVHRREATGWMWRVHRSCAFERPTLYTTIWLHVLPSPIRSSTGSSAPSPTPRGAISSRGCWPASRPPSPALAARYDMSFAAVQKHVAVLEEAGLVTKHPQGRERIVRGNPERLAQARELLLQLEQLWIVALQPARRRPRRTPPPKSSHADHLRLSDRQRRSR